MKGSAAVRSRGPWAAWWTRAGLVVLLVVFAGWGLAAGAEQADPGPIAQGTTAEHHGAEAGEHHGEGAGDQGEATDGGHGELGAELPLWSGIPFAGILLSIALGPLLVPHFWHRHFAKISAFWALAFAVPFVIAFKGAAVHEILHIYLIDYIPFIVLLWALFTASGGILLRGRLAGTPLVNLIMILIGTALASWIGTTGAAMLMIRPILRANAQRRSRVHIVVFFIFLVANVGGALTPLGDPPLFLGFLHHVPFFWTTTNLFPHMIFVVAILLAVFFLWDTLLYRREQADLPPAKSEPLRLEGAHNFLFLGGVLGGVLLSGMWRPGEINVLGVQLGIQSIARELILITMGLLSVITTRKQIRTDNEFTWFPIQEVAYLFAGIFMTIIPALAILRAGPDGALAWLLAAVQEPVHYFWVTGGLSSFLDNAPTYLTFFNSALGKFSAGMPEPEAVAALIRDKSIYLKAIAAGAVFMGANTYIGNAPNFMVRSIAQESGVPMPSFFGFMIRFSIPILIPIFVLVTLVFF
ncbi:MAG: sodium:proton antiporter [Candidatus Eisenbacteria sp.]|nr:sodium:proton antiporter [Candidatus Eisenbacteria bacterium]